jgi:hypothetical protein
MANNDLVRRRGFPPIPWKELERHELSGEYVNIDGPAWDEFVGSLRLHGILNDRRITLYEGQVLDGWQLLRGCIEADVKPKFQELPEGITPEAFVEIVNDRRRHEDAETTRKRAQARRQRVAEARAAGKSERNIAAQENVSRAQVRADLKEIAGGQGCPPDPPDGKVTGLDHKKQAARKKKPAPRPKDETDGEGRLLDSLGQPVPPGLVPVFNKARAFQDIVNQLNAMNQKLTDLAHGPAGSGLMLQAVQIDLQDLKRGVRFAMPYAVCPVCQGLPKTRKANCPCKDKGWLIEGQYKGLPTEYRE